MARNHVLQIGTASGGDYSDFTPSSQYLFYLDENDYTVDTQLGNPPIYEDGSGVYPYVRNDVTSYFGPNYADYSISANQNDNQMEYGLSNGNDLPWYFNEGDVCYLAGSFRVERNQSNTDVWAVTPDSDSKWLEIYGQGVRWAISLGIWGDMNGQNYDVPDNDPHKFTIYLGNPASNTTNHLNPSMENGASMNLLGYWYTNQPQLDYETWYRVVLGVKFNTTATGWVKVGMNGVQWADWSDVYTVDDAESSPTVDKIVMMGTLCQPQYNCPTHNILWQRVLMTRNWQDIVDAGYMDTEITPT